MNWHYNGFHAWYATSAYIQAFVDHNGSRTAVTLQSGSIGGGFDWSGSYTLTVAAGDTYGFIVGGRNFDSDDRLLGTLTVNMPDMTAPTLTVPSDVTDDVDGAVLPDCSVPANTPTQFPVGTTVVTCTATDAAGNISPAQSFNVTVTYPWSGFLRPINNDGTSVFRAGSTVPVKFALTGADGPITGGGATLSFTKLSSSAEGTYVEAVSTAASTTGSQFRYDDGQYIFNWSTKGLSAGTYKLNADLGDGVSHTVQISLK